MFFNISSWIDNHLRYKFIFAISMALLTASLVFLLLFVSVYRSQLAQERSSASESVNLLLQAALENAMLKRDLEGLRNIIIRLGQQKGILNAFIINPASEVRFASSDMQLGQYVEEVNDYFKLRAPTTQFFTNEHGEEVLRSINPVNNKLLCIDCHGALEDHPINGILFVDYDASTIRERAFQSGLFLVGAGSLVVILALLTLSGFMHRFILSPIRQLVHASRLMSQGDFDTRVNIANRDELGTLATTFNQMATNLQISLRQIEEQKCFLQSLIDAVPDGIRVIDQDYKIIAANRAYHELLGITDSLDTYCYYSCYQREQPCPATLHTCPIHEVPQTHQPIKLMTEYKCQGDKRLQVEVCAAPMVVQLNNQQTTLVVESIRDLSQVVEFSHEQKLSAVGQLAAGVAHEIYNPLSAIRIALQNTLRILEQPTSEWHDVKHYLQIVDSQIDICIEVAQRLLKFSTPSGRNSQLVALNDAVKETVSLLAYESQSRQIEIKTHLTESENRVLASESDIHMLVLNLMQNAFHAMPQGGVIDISVHRIDHNVQLTIQDTGKGIPIQIINKIFDPFFSHRADGVKGTGLGLAISQSIVTRYQGRIEASNHPQGGAQFTVTLPQYMGKHSEVR